MTQFEHSSETQAEIVQALQPIYAALVREFVIEAPEFPANGASEQAAQWLEQVDSHIQVHQLRQFLQTTTLANEPTLRNLLLYHLRKPQKAAADRDRIDFLLVQYFSLCAPTGMEDSDVGFDVVGQVLEPVLGERPVGGAEWSTRLEAIMQGASQCRRLSDLLHSGIIEKGRELKAKAGDRFYEPAAMVAFARFSFVMRRVFFRLMHHDLNAIQDGLLEVERDGVTSIDCRRAQFSAEEPTTRLRMICQSWKVIFHAEYSSGQPLRMLVDLRAAVDDALKTRQATGKSESAFAAGAAAGSDGNPEKA